MAKEAGTLFKSLNLNQEGAQKLIDMYVSKTQEAFQQPYKAYRDLREGWVKEVKSSPDLGPRFDQVRTTIARAIDGIGDPQLATQFREAMDLTGAGDHPAFIRMFYRLAQAVTEGRPAEGGRPSPFGQRNPATGAPTAASVLYPNLP